MLKVAVHDTHRVTLGDAQPLDHGAAQPGLLARRAFDDPPGWIGCSGLGQRGAADVVVAVVDDDDLVAEAAQGYGQSRLQGCDVARFVSRGYDHREPLTSHAPHDRWSLLARCGDLRF